MVPQLDNKDTRRIIVSLGSGNNFAMKKPAARKIPERSLRTSKIPWTGKCVMINKISGIPLPRPIACAIISLSKYKHAQQLG